MSNIHIGDGYIINSFNSQLSVIQENLNIPIDNKDSTAVQFGDPSFPYGTRFRCQADIDRCLDGYSHFKHWMDVLDALAGMTCAYIITLDASDITDDQWARSTDTASPFNFSRTIFIDEGHWNITGPSPSNWPVIGSYSNQSIVSVQTGNSNPHITTSGTPYTTGALKGYFIRLSTGQIACIHDNTTSTIYTIQSLSPAPTVGSTTFDIVRPYQLQNTLNGTTEFLSGSPGVFVWGDGRPHQSSSFNYIENLGFNAFGSISSIHIVNDFGRWEFNYCDFDQSFNTSGFYHMVLQYGSYILVQNSVRRGNVSNSVGFHGSTYANCTLYFYLCYMGGGGVVFGINRGNLICYSTVVDGGGSFNWPASVIYISPWSHDSTIGSFGSNKTTTIRAKSGYAGLRLRGCASPSIVGNISFEKCTQPCILLEYGANFREESGGLLDGGGNTDVGISVQSNSTLILSNSSTNTIAGSSGTIKVDSYTFDTLNNFKAHVPFVDITSGARATSE